MDYVRPTSSNSGLEMLVHAACEMKPATELLEAKNECIKNPKAIGVSQHPSGKYVVELSHKGPPYKPVGQYKWICVKAFYPKLKQLVFVTLDGAKQRKFKRGILKERYTLENNMAVKLFHHTCAHLKEKKCNNCKHENWHAKCKNGHEFFLLEQVDTFDVEETTMKGE